MSDDDGWDIADVYADLVGVADVAKELDVTARRVIRWAERRAHTGAPRPVREISGMHVYSLAEWHSWWRLWCLTRSGVAVRTNTDKREAEQAEQAEQQD